MNLNRSQGRAILTIFLSSLAVLILSPNGVSAFPIRPQPSDSTADSSLLSPPCPMAELNSESMINAQVPRNPTGNPRRGRQGGGMYDPQTVETIQGQVVEVNEVNSRGGRNQGVHLLFKTNTETIDLHLGPSWYLDQQRIQFEPNDTLEVTGSKITGQGQTAMIVQEVKKGSQTLQLRDENGLPLWRKQR